MDMTSFPISHLVTIEIPLECPDRVCKQSFQFDSSNSNIIWTAIAFKTMRKNNITKFCEGNGYERAPFIFLMQESSEVNVKMVFVWCL